MGGNAVSAAPDRYALACEAAGRLNLPLEPDELATLASDHDFGDAELSALAVTLDYLAEKRRWKGNPFWNNTRVYELGDKNSKNLS